jgi:hypothetical protein
LKTTLISAALATIALGALPANATTYCRSDPVSVHDGATVTTSWQMTSSRARRMVHPSQKAPTTHCSTGWRVLGGFYRPIEMIEKPRLNTATSGRYAISYRALNAGNDRMVIRVYWLSRTNQTMSGTVIYNIQVVDHEL